MNMSAVINIEVENDGSEELLLRTKQIGVRRNRGGMFFAFVCLSV